MAAPAYFDSTKRFLDEDHTESSYDQQEPGPEHFRMKSSLRFGSNLKRFSVGSVGSMRGVFSDTLEQIKTIFEKSDEEKNGLLDSKQLMLALSELTDSEVTWEDTTTILKEFDKDGSGAIDISEFTIMASFLDDKDEDDFAVKMDQAVIVSKKVENKILNEVSSKIYPFRDILCVQGEMNPSTITYSDHDKDFKPAFAPSQMRCLALVSHNEMKATMKKFVIANRNILKKFRLTGTNSTMTMLKEVFKDESGVVFGPECQSGPLGGDAELVALMCSGRLGGMIFFQDPMNAHPHQSDIACLTRQALVHNTMIASTPLTAYMLVNQLRIALEGRGKPELIPSFFFSLQSPAVAAYKAAQKRVIASHSAV